MLPQMATYCPLGETCGVDLHKSNLDKIVFGKARINKDGTTAQRLGVLK